MANTNVHNYLMQNQHRNHTPGSLEFSTAPLYLRGQLFTLIKQNLSLKSISHQRKPVQLKIQLFVITAVNSFQDGMARNTPLNKPFSRCPSGHRPMGPHAQFQPTKRVGVAHVPSGVRHLRGGVPPPCASPLTLEPAWGWQSQAGRGRSCRATRQRGRARQEQEVDSGCAELRGFRGCSSVTADHT